MIPPRDDPTNRVSWALGTRPKVIKKIKGKNPDHEPDMDNGYAADMDMEMDIDMNNKYEGYIKAKLHEDTAKVND